MRIAIAIWLAESGLSALHAAVDFPAPDALRSSAVWDTPDFFAGWTGPSANRGEEHRTYRGRCQIFGHQAQAVTGLFEGGRLSSITIVVLDAGGWFGFVPDAQAKQVAASKGPQFAALCKQTGIDSERGLAGLAGGAGKKVPFIEKGLLKHEVVLFHAGDLWTRLTVRENQLVKLTVARSEIDATSPLSAMRRTSKKDEQLRQFSARVRSGENGDRLLDGVPIFTQGDRAIKELTVTVVPEIEPSLLYTQSVRLRERTPNKFDLNANAHLWYLAEGEKAVIAVKQKRRKK